MFGRPETLVTESRYHRTRSSRNFAPQYQHVANHFLKRITFKGGPHWHPLTSKNQTYWLNPYFHTNTLSFEFNDALGLFTREFKPAQ
jgi:hypothetical protein